MSPQSLRPRIGTVVLVFRNELGREDSLISSCPAGSGCGCNDEVNKTLVTFTSGAVEGRPTAQAGQKCCACTCVCRAVVWGTPCSLWPQANCPSCLAFRGEEGVCVRQSRLFLLSSSFIGPQRTTSTWQLAPLLSQLEPSRWERRIQIGLPRWS